MADDIFKWIRNISALNDEQLKQEIDLVHQSSIKAFARALAKVRRPEVDTHTLRNGILTEHDFADTINLLLSIGEQTELFPQIIIRQAHSGKELCRHIVKPFTVMTTQSQV